MHRHGASILWLAWLAAITPVFLTGCSYPLRVDSDYGPAFKLTNPGPRFAWRPGFESTWSDPTVPYFETRVFIRDTLVKCLEARGFTPAPPAEADLWIDYRFSSESRDDPYEHFIKYEVSKIVFHVLDPSSRQGVWRAWAESRVPESYTPRQHQDELRKAVEELVRRFPYQPRAAVPPATKPEAADPELNLEDVSP